MPDYGPEIRVNASGPGAVPDYTFPNKLDYLIDSIDARCTRTNAKAPSVNPGLIASLGDPK